MSRSQPHPAPDTWSQIGRRPQPRLGALLAAAGALAGLSLVVSSCKKDTEALVIVALTAAPADATLTAVTITAGSVKQTFALPQGRGLSSTAISFGLYLPSSVTGSIDVGATATAAGAAACSGYRAAPPLS
jgi:hypothetical protein